MSTLKPTISSIYYDQTKNSIVFTGSNLTDSLDVSKFSLKLGSQKYTLTNEDSASFLSSTAFSITLASVSPNANEKWSLSALSGWDDLGNSTATSSAISSLNLNFSTISVTGFNDTGAAINDTDTSTVIAPFASLSISDSFTGADSYSASVSFTAANGRLTSSLGDLSGTTSKGIITYNFTRADITALQADLAALIFNPTLHQVATGKTVSTSFSLNISSSDKQSILFASNAVSPNPINTNLLLLDKDGNLVTAGSAASDTGGITDFIKYSFTSSNLNTFTSSVVNTPTDTTPTGLAIDSNGHIFVADFGVNENGYNTITEFSATGDKIKTLTTDLADLSSIATDSKGDLYLTGSAGELEQFVIDSMSTDSTASTPVWNDVVNFLGSSIALDGDGNVYVIEGNQVSKYANANGALLQQYSDNLNTPTSLIFDNNGNLYVTDSGTGVIKITTANGVSSLLTPHLGSENLPLGASAVTTDASGNVYAAFTDNVIVKYSSTGVVLKTINVTNTDSALTNLVVDSQGNLFSNTASGVIEVYASPLALASNSYTTPAVVVTGTAPPMITAASYDASMGQLTLTGQYLTTNASDYLVNNFTIKGQNKISYTLLSDTSAVSSATDTEVVIDLSAANQLAINGLLNKLGTKAIDKNAFNLSATAGWDTGALAIKTQSITVTAVPDTPPSFDHVVSSYNSATGILTISGAAGLVNLGNSSGLVLKDFKLFAGNKSLTLSATDGVSAITASDSSFFVVLSATEQKSVNAFFTNDGNANSSYSLSVSAGWDAGLGTSASTFVDVKGHININASTGNNYVSASSSITPFASLSLTDSNDSATDSAIITVPSGTLTDNGADILTTVSTVKGVSTYAIAATDPESLQTALHSLVYSPVRAKLPATVPISLTLTDNVIKAINLPSLSFDSKLSGIGSELIDSKGNLITVSYTPNLSSYSSTITKFSNAGKQLSFFTVATGADNVAVDNSGNFYFDTSDANSSARIAVKYSASGKLSTFTGGLVTPGFITTDSKGNVYIANNDDTNHIGSVNEYSASGSLLRTFQNGTAAYSSVNNIAIDSKGSVYLVAVDSQGSYGVDKYNSTGTLLSSLTEGLVNPHKVAIDSVGNVFVADAGDGSSGGFVKEFSDSGSLLNTLSTGITDPINIAFDRQGNVYVTNSLYNTDTSLSTDSVVEFSAAGKFLRSLDTSLSTGTTSSYTSTAVDTNGNLFVAHDGANTIINKYSPAAISPVTASTTTKLVFGTTSGSNTNYTITANELSKPNIIPASKTGDGIIIKDATKFVSVGITSEQVIAGGGDTNTLAGWVKGALSSSGAKLSSHAIGWFQFGEDTYLLEQAGKAGSAYTASDTLIKLVGVQTDEATASFIPATHKLILA